MLSMKSVASALVLVASAADVAAPVLVAPALVLAGSTVVHAEEARTLRREVVRFDDLNLAAPSGMAAFRARLKAAAQAVCSPQADRRDFADTADYQACMAKASHDAASALPQVQQQASRSSHAG